MIATIINKKYILCILDLEPYRGFLKEKKIIKFFWCGIMWYVNNVGVHIKVVYVNKNIDSIILSGFFSNIEILF